MNVFEVGALILSGVVFAGITLAFVWNVVAELLAERRFLKREERRR